MISNEQVNRWGLITNLILLCTGGVRFLGDLAVSAYSSTAPSSLIAPGKERLDTLLFVGLLVAIAGGISWSVIERIAGWTIGAGGSNDGWSAVAASMSMTVPLIVVPIVYQHFANTHLLLPRHLIAGAVIIVSNACGWIFMYGWRAVGLAGVKNIIEPMPPSPNWRKRATMELVFTIVNFCSIVLIYRVIVDSQFGALTISIVEKVVVPAVVFFSGMAVFTLVKYPQSIVDPKWIEIRGVVGGTLLVITLTGGMLM